jgi:hypothetical protein
MSTTYNGTLDTIARSITHKGDITWADATNWSTYTSWATHTSTTAQITTGALGSALKYSTDIIDLGETKEFYLETSHSADGTIRPVVEYSTSDSALSSPSFLGKYTDNNLPTGTPQTFSVLNHYEEGYCDEDTSLQQGYVPVQARYLRINAFVEKFSSATTRAIPTLNAFNWTLLFDKVTENLNDVSVSGDAHTLTFSKIDFLTNIQVTVQSQTGKTLVPQVVNKASRQIKVIDANSFSTDGVAAVVDVKAEGLKSKFEMTTKGLTEAQN